MKKCLIVFVVLLPVLSIAQNIAVSNDGSQPDQTAILDIKSNSKGLLIPRMTSLERTTIAGPALGLTVFDVTSASYWMYRGDLNGGWTEMQHSYQNFWASSGNNAFNTNAGNIGIGTNVPGEKLSINGTNPALQMMNGGTAKGYLQASSSDLKLGTYANNTTGNLVFTTKAVDRMWIDETGRVGIGTASPSSLLTVNGTNPYIELQNGGVDKGFVQANGNDLRIGTNSANTTGNLVLQTKLVNRVLIDENGLVGIGTNSPSSVLTVNGTNPIIQLRNGEVDKGFVQLVDNSIKIGTNQSNEYGVFAVRTKGADRMYVNWDGQVGIGTTSASGWNNMLAIGQNSFGTAGIDFRTDVNGTRASIGFSSSSGSITQYGGTFRISTSGDGLVWQSNGNISVGGTESATGYRLSVHGKVIATDYTTMAINNWPDYVFGPQYRLMPLSDVRNYINDHKHLPNIPAASEIEKNGLQLGDMNKRLMEKVEELTLYIIDLQEQINVLKKGK